MGFILAVPLWLLLMVLQAWDSAQRSGPEAIASSSVRSAERRRRPPRAVPAFINAGAERSAATRRNPAEAEAFRRALIALPAVGLAAGVLLSAAVALMAFRALLGTPVPFVVGPDHAPRRDVVDVGVNGHAGCANALCACAGRGARASAARVAAGEARLSALQARMNPHFLFNALNTVAALIRSEPVRAERATENLSDVLRMTLRDRRHQRIRRRRSPYVRALARDRAGTMGRAAAGQLDDRFSKAEAAALPPLVCSRSSKLPPPRDGIPDRWRDNLDFHRPAAGRSCVVVADDGAGFPPAPEERTGLGNLRQRLLGNLRRRARRSLVGSPSRGAEVTCERRSRSRKCAR